MFAMYKQRTEDNRLWKFAIVESMHFLSDEHMGEPYAHLWEWTGSTSSLLPDFLDCLSWEVIKPHFARVTVLASDIHFEFVNVVCGTVINPATRNDLDGGIQCSSSGPDKLWVSVP